MELKTGQLKTKKKGQKITKYVVMRKDIKAGELRRRGSHPIPSHDTPHVSVEKLHPFGTRDTRQDKNRQIPI